MRVDLHNHTLFSPDSLARPELIERWALRRGMDAIAITDHDTLRGARVAARRLSLPVIIGEEVRTTQGEIIGLFLREEVPAGMSPLATARAIKEQGGVVYIPHPCDRLRRASALAPEALLEILAWIDVIEVMNARVLSRLDNQAALELAERHKLLQGAGSDAHAASEIGRAYVDLPAYEDAATFLKALAQGHIVGRIAPPITRISSSYARAAKQAGLISAVTRRYLAS